MKLRAKFERRPTTTAVPDPAPSIPDRDPRVTPAARNLALAHYLSRMI